jgi:hypothetical protein
MAEGQSDQSPSAFMGSASVGRIDVVSRSLAAGTGLAMLACTAGFASAGPNESRLSTELAGRTAGAPANCIFAARMEGPIIIDRQTIIFRENGRRVWRADLGDTCRSLREDMILILRSRESRLCRNDVFQSLEPGSRIPSGTCQFRQFTPYDKP